MFRSAALVSNPAARLRVIRIRVMAAAAMLGLLASAGMPQSGSAAEGVSGGHPAIIVDVTARAILAGREADRRWHPASLTKMMTALTAFRMIERGEATPGSPVKVSARALRQPPSKMAYPVGTLMRLEDALPMLIVKSANDIAVAIAESLSGSVDGFVAEMNREAFRLGLSNTVFTNPTGLHDPAQFSSARDIALIAAAIRTDFPQYSAWFGHDALLVNKATLSSFNLLIGRYEGADGMKTGFVCASGYNQAASATRGDRTLVAVVLGAASQSERAQELAALLEQGFAAADGVPLASGPTDPSPPPDMRPRTCPAGAPPAEDADLAEPSSPFLGKKAGKTINPLRVRVGRPDGPVPAAAQVFIGASAPKAKPVPVPTPRPADAPGASGASGNLRGPNP
jgi:D-alanyl-D-alanine carboxypeptidase